MPRQNCSLAFGYQSKWSGLRQRINAVYETSPVALGKAGAGKGMPGKPPERPPAVHLDSALYDWSSRLVSGYWSNLGKEFTDKNVQVKPFTDGKSFSASVRQYVDSMKTSGHDASVFVDEVWKKRIDKEWRESLTRESMLGKVEYASLDQAVSELTQSKFNYMFVLYAAIILAIVVLVWKLVGRKSKPAPDAGTPPSA